MLPIGDDSSDRSSGYGGAIKTRPAFAPFILLFGHRLRGQVNSCTRILGPLSHWFHGCALKLYSVTLVICTSDFVVETASNCVIQCHSVLQADNSE